MVNIALLIANIIAFFYLSSGLSIIFQNLLFGKTVFTPALIKSVSALLLFFILMFFLSKKLNKKTFFSVLFFAIILTLSFDSIILHSYTKVGLGNSLSAFLYNYSLLIFFLPAYFLLLPYLYKGNSLSTSALSKINIILAILSSILIIFQAITNNHIIWNLIDNLQELNQSGLIRLSQIGEVTRWSGIFRTPLEAGILSVFVLVVLIEYFFQKRKNSLLLILIFIVSASILLTGSRSAILMGLVSASYMLFQKLIIKRNILKRGIFIFFSMLAIISIFYIFLFFVRSSFFSSISDPTNLYIRLENWTNLINKLAEKGEYILFGLGIVQNGTYGDYHSVIIDNMYIGILLTAGIVGLVMWLFMFFLFHFQTSYFFKRVGIRTDVVTSFSLGFMSAALTENLMHLLFIVPMLSLVYATYKTSGKIEF